jgi:hypothetical protein
MLRTMLPAGPSLQSVRFVGAAESSKNVLALTDRSMHRDVPQVNHDRFLTNIVYACRASI